MIPFEEAYRIVMDSAIAMPQETIAFTEATGRILAEDICSDADMPPFNRSAVDGYACRRSDLGNEMDVVEVIAAGKEPRKKPCQRQCSKIMTGAIVPEGCDVVFMVEDSETLASGKVRFTGKSTKENISFRGEDVKEGEIVLRKGKELNSADIAVLASFGHVNIAVSRRPKVAVISTGDEIVEPFNKPLRSQIRNSNSYQLLSQIAVSGGEGLYYGIAPDTGNSAFDIITRAISETDIVILTGGVSMGDFDFVPSFLEKAGVKLMFNRVNVQPGKPTTFGVHEKALVFGLPGNPVSSFIQFETLIKPLIKKITGADWKQKVMKLPLGARYERKSASRLGWVPVMLNDNNEIIPVEYHGSAHITALSYSEGIIMIPPGVSLVEKGTLIEFRSF
ncbi:MAG TPA: gephyrin-like molybdotransferase Glp [Bacteroidales bacterium]|nr:gephyrin-like molybdotransferase Glp [Bacteroidales bacterium]